MKILFKALYWYYILSIIIYSQIKSLVTMRMMYCSLNVSMIDYQHEMSDNTFYTVKMTLKIAVLAKVSYS